MPLVEFDFSFTGYSLDEGMHNIDDVPEEPQRALKCLVVHDSATGMIAAIPCESKGDTRYLGIELMGSSKAWATVDSEVRQRARHIDSSTCGCHRKAEAGTPD